MLRLSLANKYRPKNFSDMIGQNVALKTLKNALDNQNVHNCYLFTGTRGIGKTTFARILAKCLNCTNQNSITSSPCGKCESCLEITNGTFIDVIEIDAASKTKVEDTREILNQIEYLPNKGRFKVYIIDEIHMLSNHSFNALLKTLEEPPSYVRFILATTDPHKIPKTIISRCIQYNLVSFNEESIVSHLADILDLEKINYEIPALEIIAKVAKGSMRDGLSITEQAISYSNSNLTLQAINSMLGIVDEAKILELIMMIVQKQAVETIKLWNEIATNNINNLTFIDNLLIIIQKIALLKQIPNFKTKQDKILNKLIDNIDESYLQIYYQILLNGKKDINYAPAGKGVEMILLRMLTFAPMPKQKVKYDINPKTEQTGDIQKKNDHEKTKEDQIITKHTKLAELNISKDLVNKWSNLTQKLTLSGMLKSIINNTILINETDEKLKILIESSSYKQLNKDDISQLNQACRNFYNPMISLNFEVVDDFSKSQKLNTPYLINKKKLDLLIDNKKQQFLNQPEVKILTQELGAKLIDFKPKIKND